VSQRLISFWRRRWQLIVALAFLLGVPFLAAVLAMTTAR
jgi:hypothetical protein